MEQFLARLRKIVPVRVADSIRPVYHYVLAVAGAAIYRFPARKLTVIGITGTKGKSTTCALTAAVLEAGGHKVGMISGVTIQVGNEQRLNPTTMTSFGRFQTQKMIREIADAGCTHLVLEVPSHAIYWRRQWGVPFQTAVFTNLSRDHMDLHRTMERYRNTKGKLFASLGKNKKQKTLAVVNGEDAEAPYFMSCFADDKYVFGLTKAISQVSPLAHSVIATSVKSNARGSSFIVEARDKSFPVSIKLPGEFNVRNALAAISVGLGHGVAPDKIAEGLAGVEGVPGRMERVDAGQPFDIIVDFAHSPDSFDKVLSELSKITPGKLISVFGAPGNRDKSKFSEMGRIAATHSDWMVLTEDDPGTEDPAELTEYLVEGIKRATKPAQYEIELDRRKAIAKAFGRAHRGDTVVLLAKGHQTTMRYADAYTPWDDRVIAREEWHRLHK